MVQKDMNQDVLIISLRGRAGRQGDPGESRFYISLEDDLMRLFGQERLMSIFNTLGVGRA